MNFTSSLYERLICSEELGNSPSNAHAYRLYVVNDPLQDSPALRYLVLPLFAAISEARYYDRFFGGLSTHLDFFADDLFRFASSRRRHQQSPRFYTDF